MRFSELDVNDESRVYKSMRASFGMNSFASSRMSKRVKYLKEVSQPYNFDGDARGSM